MSFSKDVILSLAILGVVLESDLGRKKIGWFRITRPVIVAAAIIPIFFSSLPTSGDDVLLQGTGALLGIVLGSLAISPLCMAVGYDPDVRTWWSKVRSRPATAAAVTVAGSRYALIWVAATAGRLAFAWSSQHVFPHALGVFLTRHQLSPVALTNALIFLPLAMDVCRSGGLLVRGSGALRRSRVQAQVS